MGIAGEKRLKQGAHSSLHSVCFTPQLRESSLEFTDVGQADATLDHYPDAEYSHSNIADVFILQKKEVFVISH